MEKILIYVEGGCVSHVFSKEQEIEILIVDFDEESHIEQASRFITDQGLVVAWTETSEVNPKHVREWIDRITDKNFIEDFDEFIKHKDDA